MGNIRTWTSLVAQDYKGKKVSAPRVSELLEHLQSELSCEDPDYPSCAETLMSFHYQYMGNFYEKLYNTLSKNMQYKLNVAISDSIKANPQKRTMKMALVIGWRLKRIKTGNEIVPELNIYISNYVDKSVSSEIQNIRDNCQETTLQKLLSINIQDWEISRNRVKFFYQLLFEDSTDIKTKEMYQKFLSDNYLNDSPAQSDTVDTTKITPEAISSSVYGSLHEQNTIVSPGNSQREASIAETTPPINVSKDSPEVAPPQSCADTEAVKDTHGDFDSKKADSLSLDEFPCYQSTIVTVDNSQNSTLKSETIPSTNILQTVAGDVPPPASPHPHTEQGLEKNGVKLAELLLAWSRKQASGTAALKESLRMSERENNRLGTQLSSLRDELFAAKKELSGRDAESASLRSQLAETAAHLDSSRKQAAEFDETIRKLQRMNENSASQAVAGYKAELAAALKSIVEDARLPEAQKDADILSALLGDLLDTLRFKGIPLEEK